MQWVQCPRCYSPLEPTSVTPCFICGGWPESVARFNSTQIYREYSLPDGQKIVLCSACEVEEFMVEGGWGYVLELETNRLPIKALSFVREHNQPELGFDQYCPECKLRLAFLKLLAEAQPNTLSD
jgi:hypothetical protein